jgi:hypothetical protein
MREAAYRVVRDLHGVLHSISMSNIGSSQSDIFLLISETCADDHGFAVTYDRDQQRCRPKEAHPIARN